MAKTSDATTRINLAKFSSPVDGQPTDTVLSPDNYRDDGAGVLSLGSEQFGVSNNEPSLPSGGKYFGRTYNIELGKSIISKKIFRTWEAGIYRCLPICSLSQSFRSHCVVDRQSRQHVHHVLLSGPLVLHTVAHVCRPEVSWRISLLLRIGVYLQRNLHSVAADDRYL